MTGSWYYWCCAGWVVIASTLLCMIAQLASESDKQMLK
eukprot:CAMPEP_0170474316 /NCGR_PEP_ID=MMETSP0123-20130129/16117_1 /TAXON_ID=182087 /ORGANISM="Favella ehrenbergii, Strain Fehren 1" /LENGTH=37 /DNA_ID= /DNA_START= /DNA_END= /DNA_ORIENTATION=